MHREARRELLEMRMLQKNSVMASLVGRSPEQIGGTAPYEFSFAFEAELRCINGSTSMASWGRLARFIPESNNDGK